MQLANHVHCVAGMRHNEQANEINEINEAHAKSIHAKQKVVELARALVTSLDVDAPPADVAAVLVELRVMLTAERYAHEEFVFVVRGELPLNRQHAA